jgi:Domain of unknown function (DUF1906)
VRRPGRAAPAWAAAVTLVAVALSGAVPGSAFASADRAVVAAPGAGPMRTITYLGYRLSVPASWPVYRLSADPARCVLFNQHAVYLGSPGADQSCPVSAFGRTEALLVQPLAALTGLPPGTAVERGSRSTVPAGPAAADDAVSHALQVALPSAGVLVTVTYGEDEALARTIMDSGRAVRADATSARGVTSGGAAGFGAPVSGAGVSGSRVSGSGVSGSGVSRARASEQRGTVGSSVLAGERGRGLGFDACTAPSVATMTAWLASPYRVAGTYLGGDNWACTYGNFTPSWVTQVAAEGWGFIPIWVGPQAPCSTIPGAVLIDPAKAKAQGQAQAASAAATAASFGYGSGTPVYFDMEGYSTSTAGCKDAVLDFIDGWTQGLHAAGYLSGVYSSAGSGIADLASRYGKPGYSSPDDIWIADWTGDPVLTDPYVPNADWPSHQRLHQYYGGHMETWGGASVDVDNDVIGGAVAGLPRAPGPPAAFVASVPDAVTVAPGSTAVVRLVIGGTDQRRRPGTRVSWQVQAPAGLSVYPDHGVAQAPAGRTVVLPLTVAASSAAVTGRYDLPVTAAAGGQALTETYELVSVTTAGTTLPTAQPIVLYAADRASMGVAAQLAHALALPVSDLTGSFADAWTDLTGGNDVVLAVGQAAANALNTNPCGWSNPAGTGPGSTPFFYSGEPLQQTAGADVFVNAAGSSPAATGLVTSRLMHYALTGDLPNEGTVTAGPSVPTTVCLGRPDVPTP